MSPPATGTVPIITFFFLGMVINPFHAAKIGKSFCHTNITETFFWTTFLILQ